MLEKITDTVGDWIENTYSGDDSYAFLIIIFIDLVLVQL